jgi:hypothetical protein
MTGLMRANIWLGAAIVAAICSTNSWAQQGGIADSPQPLPIKAMAEPETDMTGWQRFQIGEPPLFSVSFPRSPQSASKRITGNDGAGDVWLFFVANTTTVVTASYAVNDSGQPISEHSKWVLFNNWAAGFTNSMIKNATLGATGPVSILVERRVRSKSGIEGFERTVVTGGCSVRIQSFSIGPRILTLAAVWRIASPKSEPAYFFDSLNIDMAQGSREAALISSPLVEWKRYEFADGLISAMLPKGPVADREFAAPLDRTKAAPVFFTAESDDALFGVGYMPELPVSVSSNSDLAALYTSTWSMLEDNLRRIIKRELEPRELQAKPEFQFSAGAAQPVVVGGLPGEEKTLRSSNGLEFRGQLALSGRRMFIVLVASSIETPLATREAFLHTLRFKSTLPKP